jgi:hypothetical protein
MADRVNLTPYFERLFGIGRMKSEAEIDALCDAIEAEATGAPITDVAAMAALAERVRQRLAAAVPRRRSKPSREEG